MMPFWDLLREYPAIGPIIGAVIGAIAAVLLVPFINKWIRAKKRLVVTLRLSEWKPPERIRSLIDAEARRMGSGDPDTMSLLILENGKSYIRMTIKNKSNTKITNITLRSERVSHLVHQIEDQADLGVIEFKKGGSIAVGEVQPRHEKRVHLWSMDDLSHMFNQPKLFTVSADEVDRVVFRRPIPSHTKEKLADFGRLVLFVAGLVLAAFGVIWGQMGTKK
jgi:hypothetical protein